MKKIISITLSVLMVLASLALVACGNDTANEQETLKFGLGVYTNVCNFHRPNLQDYSLATMPRKQGLQ